MATRKWEDLEPECLVKIFQKVGLPELPELLFDVPLVCESWYKTSLSPDCWKSLNFHTCLLDDYELPRCKRADCQRSKRMKNYYKRMVNTGMIMLAISRSSGAALEARLPFFCTPVALEFISVGCPALKLLVLPHTILGDEHKDSALKLIGSLKELQVLLLDNAYCSSTTIKEILTQINVNCKKFAGLCVYNHSINIKAALAIATILPKIKYLALKWDVPRKSLKLILHGCKELEVLELRVPRGFEEDKDDAKLLKMTSHIKVIKSVQGEMLNYPCLSCNSV